MSPREVDLVMGSPDGVTTQGNVTVYRYVNRFVPFQGPNAANYYAAFENDSLVSWGLESRNSTGWGSFASNP